MNPRIRSSFNAQLYPETNYVRVFERDAMFSLCDGNLNFPEPEDRIARADEVLLRMGFERTRPWKYMSWGLFAPVERVPNDQQPNKQESNIKNGNSIIQ